MPIQSYLMMYFAGAGWQIGKRKVSAIPNDKFNPMSSNDFLKQFTADLRDSLPILKESLRDITPLIEVLIEQYGDFIKAAISATPVAAQTIGGALVNPPGALVKPLFGVELENWIKQQFPNMPDADAKLMAVEIDKRNKNLDPTKFQPPTPSELQQKAIDKQIAFDKAKAKALLLSKKPISFFAKTPQPVAQVAAHVSKKKAGQSQIMERLRLIRSIDSNTKLLKAGGHPDNLIQAFIKRIRNSQQQLVNLLARYNF